MKRFFSVLIFLLMAGLVGGGIFFFSRHQAANQVDVVTSFYPIDYFTVKITKGRLSVRSLTPIQVEPHDYDPTSSDIVAIEGAKLLIMNGQIEPWASKITQNVQDSDTRVVLAGNNLFTRSLEEDGQIIQDPHVWLDPLLAKQEVRNISSAVQAVDPGDKLFYQQNTQALMTQLDRLHGAYQEGLAHCKQKNIITSHAAFGYLAARYGLNQVEIAGLSPDEEPSAQQLAKVADFVKDHQVQYIFFESLVSPKLSQTIAQETGAKTLELNPLEGLTEAQIRIGADYFSVMYHNLDNLKTALQCQE